MTFTENIFEISDNINDLDRCFSFGSCQNLELTQFVSKPITISPSSSIQDSIPPSKRSSIRSSLQSSIISSILDSEFGSCFALESELDSSIVESDSTKIQIQHVAPNEKNPQQTLKRRPVNPLDKTNQKGQSPKNSEMNKKGLTINTEHSHDNSFNIGLNTQFKNDTTVTLANSIKSAYDLKQLQPLPQLPSKKQQLLRQNQQKLQPKIQEQQQQQQQQPKKQLPVQQNEQQISLPPGSKNTPVQLGRRSSINPKHWIKERKSVRDQRQLVYNGMNVLSIIMSKMELKPWEQAAFSGLFSLPINDPFTMPYELFRNYWDSAIDLVASWKTKGKVFKTNGTRNVFTETQKQTFLEDVRKSNLDVTSFALVYFSNRNETARRHGTVKLIPSASQSVVKGGIYFDVCSFAYICRALIEEVCGTGDNDREIIDIIKSVRLQKSMRCFNLYGHVTTYSGLDEMQKLSKNHNIVIPWHNLEFYDENKGHHVGVKYDNHYLRPEEFWAQVQ